MSDINVGAPALLPPMRIGSRAGLPISRTDLEDPSSPTLDRLSNLQRVTARLVRELDVDRTLVEFDKAGELVSPRWARATVLGAPTRHISPLDRR